MIEIDPGTLYVLWWYVRQWREENLDKPTIYDIDKAIAEAGDLLVGVS